MSNENQIVAIVGGAVAGSEAVYQLTERGIRCVVIEQNDLPYGKIEDGLPKWHTKQRKKQMALINERVDQELVDFVPNTKIGRDYSMGDLVNMGCIGRYRERDRSGSLHSARYGGIEKRRQASQLHTRRCSGSPDCCDLSGRRISSL